MPYDVELKVVGWTSSYKSVQKALDMLRKEKFNDEQVSVFLDSILLLCHSSGKNPDDMVALGKQRQSETIDAFTEFMKKQNFTKDELNFRLSCLITFLGWNKAF